MPTLTKHALAALLVAGLAACGGGGGSSSSPAAAPTPPAESNDTYYSFAEGFIQQYCLVCHIDGGLAPFPLQTYEQVYNKLSAIVYSLETGTMPPQGFPALPQDSVDRMLAWLNAGAPEGDPSERPQLESSTQLRYHRDIRPIVEEKCVGCHTEGGIAPFALESYQQLAELAAAAAFTVDNGSMPPWPPTAGYTALDHDRSLSPSQRHSLLAWLNSDMPEGDASDYVAPDDSSAPPEPDYNLELPMPQAYTPTLRPDDHRCFAIEWPLDELAYVTDVDVLPDVVEEVHHVIVSVAEPEDAHHYYAANGEDGRPGWYCLGAGGVDGAPFPRQIGGWVPGAGRELTPEGVGYAVRPGSVVVVQMHYNTLVAEPEPDQSTVLIATADEVERPASSFLITDPRWLAPGAMPIPAGEAEVHHEFNVPAFGLARIFGEEAGVLAGDPWILHQGFIHMHSLGSSGRITLQRADGTEQVLLDIRDWDFNWQGTYNFTEEVLLQPLDQLKLECNWDNSAANQPFVDGEQLAPIDVDWGDGTQDEMCLMSVLMTLPEEGRMYHHRPTVYFESPRHRQQFRAGDLVPLRLLLNNFTLNEPGGHGHTGGDHGGGGHTAVYQGHYHVYLDTEDDDAEHLTAWDSNYYFQLPEDIEPGVHYLRINLRGDDHHALGVEHRVDIEIVEDAQTAVASLVDVDAWQPQSALDDALSEHRPASFSCPENSWYNEDGALEVETGNCEYLSVAQPSLVDVSAGDDLRLVLWHGNLAFEEPATAHAALSVDGRVLWEAEVDIPTDAQIYDLRIPVSENLPAGVPVEFHLHNHGYNTWTLLKLEVESSQ